DLLLEIDREVEDVPATHARKDRRRRDQRPERDPPPQRPRLLPHRPPPYSPPTHSTWGPFPLRQAHRGGRRAAAPGAASIRRGRGRGGPPSPRARRACASRACDGCG